MIVQCCVCEKIRRGDQWVEPNEPPQPAHAVSHGYCPACAAKAFEQIAAHVARKRAETSKAVSAA